MTGFWSAVLHLTKDQKNEDSILGNRRHQNR